MAWGSGSHLGLSLLLMTCHLCYTDTRPHTESDPVDWTCTHCISNRHPGAPSPAPRPGVLTPRELLVSSEFWEPQSKDWPSAHF